MLRIFLLLLFFIFTMGAACPGGMQFNDGTWSMCQMKTKSGYMVNLPMKTNLPIGAETPNGTVVRCETIPAVSVSPTSN